MSTLLGDSVWAYPRAHGFHVNRPRMSYRDEHASKTPNRGTPCHPHIYALHASFNPPADPARGPRTSTRAPSLRGAAVSRAMPPARHGARTCDMAGAPRPGATARCG
eukprot:3093204-Prymnesium_polylepis.1